MFEILKAFNVYFIYMSIKVRLLLKIIPLSLHQC